MDCERYQESLTDAALGALDPRCDAELATHLAGCDACRGALDNERRLLAAINLGIEANVAAEPSPEFVARMRQRLEQEHLPTRPWFSTWIPVAAGALAVLVLVAVWLGQRQPAVPEKAVSVPTASSQKPAPNDARPAEENPMSESRSAHGARRASGLGSVQSAREAVARAVEPEVLVPPGQQAAILRLYEAVWGGRADPASLLAPPAPLKPAELNIPPLEVASLEVELKPLEPERNR